MGCWIEKAAMLKNKGIEIETINTLNFIKALIAIIFIAIFAAERRK